jgi:hypothetical protein
MHKGALHRYALSPLAQAPALQQALISAESSKESSSSK